MADEPRCVVCGADVTFGAYYDEDDGLPRCRLHGDAYARIHGLNRIPVLITPPVVPPQPPRPPMADRDDSERLTWLLEQNRIGYYMQAVTTRAAVDELMDDESEPFPVPPVDAEPDEDYPLCVCGHDKPHHWRTRDGDCDTCSCDGFLARVASRDAGGADR